MSADLFTWDCCVISGSEIGWGLGCTGKTESIFVLGQMK